MNYLDLNIALCNGLKNLEEETGYSITKLELSDIGWTVGRVDCSFTLHNDNAYSECIVIGVDITHPIRRDRKTINEIVDELICLAVREVERVFS